MTAAFKVLDERTGQVVGEQVREASGWWRSFKGLMFDKDLPAGHGLLFRPARGIHTHFMRFPIDVVFFDEEQRVTRLREAMPPWRIDRTRAAGCIEFRSGHARTHDIRPGDRLRFDEASASAGSG